MELNNLLTSIKKNPSETPRFFAVEIGSEIVKTAAWEISGTKPKLVSLGSIEEYSSSDPQKLIEAVDASLAVASQELDSEPNQAIFSLPASWVEGVSLTKTHKPILKLLSQKLSLQPLGFVVTNESLIQYLKLKQGAPFTGILVGVTDEDVTVSIVKNGQLLGSHQVGKSQDLGLDIQEGIARFDDPGDLPSTIVLYDGHTDLESQKQELISYDWQDKLPFLHLPKIISLTPEETVKALVETAGAEVIKSLNLQPQSAPPPSSPSPSPSPSLPQSPSIPDKSQEFGFTDDFSQSDNLVPVDQTPTPKSSSRLPSISLPALPALPHFRLPFSLPTTRTLPLIIGLVILGIVIVSSSVFAAYWYLPKATVTLYLQPSFSDTKLSFTVDPALSEPDYSNSKLPGRLIDAQAQAEAQIPTTGSKLVGDQAKGTVTLYNRTNSSKSFSAGTKLTGPDSLVYTLDEDVSVASASSKENDDLSITTEPATVQVAITASEIGTQFNLGSGTEFTVANFDKSSYLARAQSDITGGSSREVSAVAKEDVDTLTKELKQKLESQAKEQLSGNQDNFLEVILLTDEASSFEPSLSAEVGQEAQELIMNATYSSQALTYKKSDLDQLAILQASQSLPPDHQLLPDRTQVEILEFSLNDDDTYTISANAKLALAPNLDTQKVINDLRGRRPAVTESYLRSLPGFTKVAIDLNPKLPTPIATFPRVAKNITLQVDTNPGP